MRKIIFFFLLVLSGFLFSCKKECPVAECADLDLNKGLMAYYPFNGNSNDESGKGNNAVAVNGAHFGTDFLGRPSRAAEFDGVDDYFIATDNGKLNSESVTVSLQVMVKNTSRRHAFIGRSKFQDASAVVWGLGQSLESTNVFDFVVDDKSVACSTPYVYNPGNLVSTPETMIAGRWYHLIIIFDKGKQSIYVDGSLRSTGTRSFSTLKQCSEANLLIGGWWKNDIVSLDGKVDEIRIYNRAINQCEIDELSKIFR